MAKSFSAESTHPNGSNEAIGVERLRELFRNPGKLDHIDQATYIDLILRGALFTLEQDGSDQAVEILKEAAQLCDLDSIRSLSVHSLGRLAESGCNPAVTSLYYLAVHLDNQDACQIILQNGFEGASSGLQAAFFLLNGRIPDVQRLDPDHRLLTSFFIEESGFDLQERLIRAATLAGFKTWVLLSRIAIDPSPENLKTVHNHFGAFPESERQLALDVLERLAGNQVKPAIEMICQLFIDFDFIPARELAISKGYSPSTPTLSALFYFLAEQWQIYEYLDFNQTLLSAAYEAASANLRKRILYLSRYSGRTEWINGLSTISRQRWLWDMTDADWELAVHNLRNAAQFNDLWRLAQVASPTWSALILLELSRTGWHPDLADDQEGFNRLLELTGALGKNTPPVTNLHSWPSPSPDIACLAVSQDGSYLAAGGSNSTIHLWGIYKAPSPLPPLIGPASQTRAIAFSPNNEYLAAANGDHVLRAYRLSDGKLLKSLDGHTNLVRSIVFAPDGRSLFSASFDGSVRAWRFPQGPEIKRIEAGKSELFALAASPDGQILLACGTDQKLHVYRWPDGDSLWQLSGHTNTITTMAAVPRGQLVATAGRDGSIFIWNYIAGRAILHIPGEEVITALAFHPNEQFILGATAQGNIIIWNVSTGKKIESISAHPHPITGLVIGPDGQQVYSASVDGVITAWDLQLFTWSRTPIGSHRSQTLAQIEQRTRQSSQKPVERAWLLFIGELIRWRQRYDVEIEETHQVISAGEFDIEL